MIFTLHSNYILSLYFSIIADFSSQGLPGESIRGPPGPPGLPGIPAVGEFTGSGEGGVSNSLLKIKSCNI